MKKYVHLLWLAVLLLVLTVGCAVSPAIEPESVGPAETLPQQEQTIRDEAQPSAEPTTVPEMPISHVVVIDPGHQRTGNYETEPNGPGASETKAKVSSGTQGQFTGVPEYELNLQIGLQLRDLLEERGYTVYMTREDHDVDISNIERAQYASQVGGEILVRIHANGSTDPSVSGALTICQTQENPYQAQYALSRLLSDCILETYCPLTGMADRGVWETDTMTGINWAEVPSTIVEMGYMSNESDDTSMADPEFQKRMVQGIADGIELYFERTAS